MYSRPLLRLLLPRRCWYPRPLLVQRQFSYSPVAHASENSDFRDSKLFRQISTNVAALEAIGNFVRLMKEEDIQLSTDAPPSQFQILKLLANSKFREGVIQLRDELEKAGVAVDSESALEMLNAFQAQQGKK